MQMTMQEFMSLMGEAFPKAEVSQDNDGQLVIHTNLMLLPHPSVAEGDDIPESHAEVWDMDDVVTCDGCDAVNLEGGWGDNPFCLDCSPADEICPEHNRTFTDGECPLDHE
jgi:hypothetical protein